MDSDQTPTTPSLFSDLAEETSLLLPVVEIRKRYTARDAGRIEGLRAAVSMLLGARWPAETIAREMHISRRTVEAISVQDAGKVADFTKEYARRLAGVGAEFLALARTKQHDATYKDLMIGFGIVTQRGQELNSTGESGEESEFQISDSPGDVAAEVLRLVRGDSASPMKQIDYESSGQVLTVNELRTESAGGTGGGTGCAVDPVAGPERIETAGGRVGEGRGGGSVSGGVCGKAMEPNDGGLQPKADL